MLDGEGQLAYDWWLYQMPEDLQMHARALLLLVNDHLPAVIRELRQRYEIDRVYLLGFSQGALTAYLAGIHQHDLVDGIIAFGSLTRAEWYSGDALAEGRDVRVLIAHGTADQRVAFSEGERARDLLRQHGYDVTFRAFDGGHIVPLDELELAIDWIETAADSR